jgi:hypothetical protein
MNMAAGIGSAQCPKCSRSVGQWAEPSMLHVCASCGAPLVRIRASRTLRLYRLIPLAELVRIAGSLITIAAIVSAVGLPSGIRPAIFMVASALTAFGTADVIQEGFALRTLNLRSTGIIDRPKVARWKAFARLAVGVICLALGLIGFVVWASITTQI